MNATLHVEQQILAVCLSLPGAVREVAGIIHKTDTFSTPDYQKVYGAMLRLNAGGYETDMITVGNELLASHGEKNGDPAGWFELLGGLLPESDAFTGNLAKSCFWLIGEAARRTLVRIYGRALSELQIPGADPLVLMDKVRGEMEAISGRLSELSETPFAHSLREAAELAEKAAQAGDPITGLRTGLSALDGFTKGLHGATMTIWAARPAMGKTAQLCQAVYNLAHLQQIPTAVFSLEMKRVQLARRLLAIDTGLMNAQVLSGLDKWGVPINVGQLFDSAGRMGDSPLHIYDHIFSLDHITAKATQLVLSHGVKAIFIDYIGLIETEDRDTQHRVARASRKLKQLANTLNVPVVALAQLSRKVEDRPNKRPIMSDLRDSGSLEQDADNIIFLYRPGYYSATDADGNPVDEHLLHNIVVKNRNGSTHNDEQAISFYYDKATNRIDAYFSHDTPTDNEQNG